MKERRGRKRKKMEMGESRLWTLCGSCEYFQPSSLYDEPRCILEEDEDSREWCRYYLRKEK